MHRPQMDDAPKSQTRTGYIHLALSLGSKEKVDSLTAKLKADGYEVVSGPRTTGDGYYESCVIAFENNLIEMTESLPENVTSGWCRRNSTVHQSGRVPQTHLVCLH